MSLQDITNSPDFYIIIYIFLCSLALQCLTIYFLNQTCPCIAWWISNRASLVCVSVRQMRARRCAAHPLTCRAAVWVRWASSYGRCVTRLWAPGTTFSLLSSALSSLPLAPCPPGWWGSSWCSTSATSKRKTSSWMRTRRTRAARWDVPRGPGVTMATEVWKCHTLFKRFKTSLLATGFPQCLLSPSSAVCDA